MSLINDALKKAQKQRTGESPPLASMPSVGGETPQRIARRAKPAGFDTLMVRAGIGGAVLLVLSVGGYFLLRDKPSAGGPVAAPAVSGPLAVPSVASREGAAGGPAAQPPAPDQSAQTTASSSQVSGFRSQVSAPSSAPAPTFTLPTAPKTEPVAAKAEPPPVSVAKSEPSQVSGFRSQVSAPRSQVSVPTPQTPDPKPQTPISAPAPKLEPHAIEFIENLKVAGIRASPTDAKVLMNDRVYRVGSMVSADFGLKLVEIAAGALTFEDNKGGRYTRTF